MFCRCCTHSPTCKAGPTACVPCSHYLLASYQCFSSNLQVLLRCHLAQKLLEHHFSLGCLPTLSKVTLKEQKNKRKWREIPMEARIYQAQYPGAALQRVNKVYLATNRSRHSPCRVLKLHVLFWEAYFAMHGSLLKFCPWDFAPMQQRLLGGQRSDRHYLEKSVLALGPQTWTFLLIFCNFHALLNVIAWLYFMKILKWPSLQSFNQLITGKLKKLLWPLHQSISAYLLSLFQLCATVSSPV